MSRWLTLIFALVLVSGCAAYATHQFDTVFGAQDTANRLDDVSATDAEFYHQQVKPILDNRCVSCHACYDAPCQLKLTATDGIERGGSKELVYDGTRLLASSPTRLFIDAKSTDEWRKKGFHPVLNEREQSPSANLQGSLLYRAVALRRQQGEFTQPVLSDDYDFSLARDQQCVSIEDYRQFERDYPNWGMPYGLPALSDNEYNVLTRWLAKGGKMPNAPVLSDTLQKQVTLWESRLNGDSLKDRLIARYIYEHLYLYSLYLGDSELGDSELAADQDSSPRFQLVRSKTPPGEPIERIATRRPYDDPGVDRVYYRFWSDREVIVQKNHIPMQLDEARYLRWQSYFYTDDYEVTRDPGYAPDVATNPFKAFREIPAHGRYRFLLDHSQKTIMSFIKGPVCRGQVAVNVINEHFWVYFVDPDVVYNQGSADYLEDQVQNLDLPAIGSSNTLPLASWVTFSEQQKSYLSAKAALIEGEEGSRVPLDLDLIWGGDGNNDNAVLTIFRHFDNASVVKGMVGQYPKTTWVIDYPLLERIHYLLVAGFDVYGNVGHQLVTRLYMDFLRMEGEMNFLLLLPKEERESVRKYWYRDVSQTIKEYIFSDYIKVDRQTQIPYETDDHQAELYEKLRAKLDDVLDRRHDLEQSALSAEQVAALYELQTVRGGGLVHLPNVATVLVTQQGVPLEVISLIHNKAHANISSLLDEEAARLPEEDGVTLVKGVLGDYPNVLMQVEENELADWANQVANLKTREDYSSLLDSFGIRRTHPNFWFVSDAIANLNKRDRPRESGILDYNRLENR
ncbi:fatty acid cis/trans isomerase [Marinomonas sp. M1K-6]|uniref:Fatty acid cis/trans isomerase n=1 Tax=Marinomonas profundi TaxID=2726122 RepID=A0A847QUH8_9GAMM|nr:fatty acid cis/trans isomerase [Marinomonas profundi]NLQ16018.1 fatty acid cis/trans isomerase [Marinomonas profundi]UDV03388.1 fatty acid cis/trans isomerase [Marinomonas profundi]